MTSCIYYIFLTIFFVCFSFKAALADDFSQASYKNCPLGKQWKVAVVEGGSYRDFISVFRQMTMRLMSEGYLHTDIYLPGFEFDNKNNWEKLSEQTKSQCISFVKDGLYNADWDEDLRQKIKQDLTARIKEKKDIDMLWAFGTVGGLDYADPSLGIPVMVITPSDPETAGIIGPGEFSDKKNVHVQKELGRTETEIKMFHDIFKIRSLGIITDVRPEQQMAQSIPKIRSLAKDLHINLVECQADCNSSDPKRNYAEFSRCMIQLSEIADAVYLTVGGGTDIDNFYSQIKPLIKNKIPTFTQNGIDDVHAGALLSLAELDMRDSGAFEADVVKKIIHGTPPHKISQYYNTPLTLALNLKTARLIEWKPPFEVLIAVDIIFQDINSK